MTGRTSGRDADRDDEDFTACAALIFLAVAAAVLAVALGTIGYAVSRWGTL